MSRVLTETLPKLRRSVPLHEQISEKEIVALRPFLNQLMSLRLLLCPTPGTVGSDADLRLFTFISRRTDRADEMFAAVKARRVQVVGPPEVTAAWTSALAAQGLSAVDHGQADLGVFAPGESGDARRTGLTIVAAADEDMLTFANRRFCAQKRSWLPVLFTPDRIRIGPWTMPGESACYCCAVPAAEGRAEAGAVPSSWLTYQPACAAWAGGLIAYTVLRAFVPMGGEHPWGRVTTLDAARCEQVSRRAWRDPYCRDCAEEAPVTLTWAAL
ncbi:hypothetical protein [Sinosporangium album]|uniref:hypothetical protein n=1 Tax=Sinosporangium album TaxID=504805 RepID=UPI000B83A1FF|nr:hypothetical protein [Sinosporangium album]